jgi:hypothetical protein
MLLSKHAEPPEMDRRERLGSSSMLSCVLNAVLLLLLLLLLSQGSPEGLCGH